MLNEATVTDHGPQRQDRPACPVLPDPPDVRRARSAQDLYDMAGWVGPDGEHVGDMVPRVFYSRERGWALWYVARAGNGEIVLTSSVIECVGCDEPTVLRRVRDAMKRYHAREEMS